MPVGGIGAGQLYLRGDGTLDCWRLFFRNPCTHIDQGFAVLARSGGKTSAWRLNRRDFPGVEFRGEYPVGVVRYSRRDAPVAIKMQAFSPFVPLDSDDSTLPATMFLITVKNVTDKPISASVLGWLDNGVLCHSKSRVVGLKHTKLQQAKGGSLILHTAGPWKTTRPTPRKDITLADFNAGDYGDWKAVGKAFGAKPAGPKGGGLANSFANGGDAPTGTLSSGEFVISRDFINLLIGGGAHKGKTCINLLVGGKVARTMTGVNTGRLAPRTWDVRALAGKKARLQIVDNFSGGWGHIIIDDIKLSDAPVKVDFTKLPDYGSMSLAVAGPAQSGKQLKAIISPLKKLSGIVAAADASYPLAEKHNAALAAPMQRIAPGKQRTFVFVLGWRFPLHNVGKHYADRFADAAAVAKYVLGRRQKLAADTLKWRDTYYDSTLPVWLLDRIHAPVSTLATDTCELWKGGRFWAWEGVVSCHGTCGHVWNYQHALARLFPKLQRSVREMQDLGVSLRADGMSGFRGDASRYAADSQGGLILKCYREHQISEDDKFLKRNWPKIKKALEFLIAQDGNDDGLIENAQHNTFDIEFYGPNTFVGALYLGALRAGEQMAEEMGDKAFAVRLRKIFASGRKLSSQKLFNGEYFIQIVDLKKHPGAQYAAGCLADQVFGQHWAHQVNLGYLYPPKQVRSALQSIWKYNWAPDTGPQNRAHHPERWFVNPKGGEAGLFICTWPKSRHLEGGSVRYRNEVWTGIEYQVAGHMVWEGMLDEALVITRTVHDRYSPAHKRNPYNEVECGCHYARAMSSWGILTALCGFEYHGPHGHIGFAPRMQADNFRAAFTAAAGWGTLWQKRSGDAQADGIEVKWGRLRVKTVALELSKALAARKPKVAVTLDGKAVKAAAKLTGQRLLITLAKDVTLTPGHSLEVKIK